MSLSKRLLNLARAEVSNLFGRSRSGSLSDAEVAALEEELKRTQREQTEDEGSRSSRGRSGSHSRSGLSETELAKYYGNLELPIGAPADEVRAAYRRLMRRYHPDRHHEDTEKTQIATRLAQELRTAHDALLLHLGGSRGG